MAKQDVVSQGVIDLQAALAQAGSAFCDAFYDKVVSDQPAPAPVGFSQADIDAAVRAAVDPLNASISDIQAKLDAEAAKESSEEAVVLGYQSAVSAMQSAVDALKALVVVAPVVPADAPVSQ